MNPNAFIILKSIPGIGPVWAAGILSEIGDITAFYSSDALANCLQSAISCMTKQKNMKRKDNEAMASVQKFAAPAVVNILRHNIRQIQNPANTDIDTERIVENYSLIAPRGISDYDYFLQRKSELYCYNRANVKVLAGWVVTAPQDLEKEKLKAFFEETHNFLAERYGKENVIQSIIHADEAGQPHLHFCFIPVVPDKKHGGEKICADKVLTRAELRNFHPALQKHLDEHGIDAKVVTGVTKAQGGNRTVKEMKQQTRDWTVNAEHQVNY